MMKAKRFYLFHNAKLSVMVVKGGRGGVRVVGLLRLDGFLKRNFHASRRIFAFIIWF